MEFFADGKLKAAYDKFEKAIALVPVKTKVRVRGTDASRLPRMWVYLQISAQ